MDEKESTASESLGNSAESSGNSALHPPHQLTTNINNVNNMAFQSVETETNAQNNTSLIISSSPTILGNSSSSRASVVDGLGKKKRGRPRKYDADGNLRVSVQQQQQQQHYHGGAAGFSLSFSSSAISNNPTMVSSSKRGRGSHSASSNFHLLSSLGEFFVNTAGGDFTPHMVTVNTGEDVGAKILSFSQKGARGVCVLSANGTVSNVTIRQPGSAGGILTYEGRFEILTLTGSFTITETGGAKSRTGGLSVSLASPDGRVIGGGVAGLLLAASPIQIVVGSFMPNSYTKHKRKYQRRHKSASPAPGTVDAAPTSRPIPDSKFESEACLNLTPMFPGQSHFRTDDAMFDRPAPHATNSHNDCWNGSNGIDRRPSPDINVSLPSDEDVQGLL